MLHGSPNQSSIIEANGTAALRLDADSGQTVRLRLINAVPPGMDGTSEAPVLLGAPYRVVALDGHDLVGPQMLGPQRIPLGMGQRADLVFTMPATGSVRLVDTQVKGQPSALEKFFHATQPTETVTLGQGATPVADPLHLPLFDATRYGTPVPAPVTAAVSYPVVLAESPGFRDGTLQLVHTINGRSSPNVPPITVHQGEVVQLHIVNDTAEYHPMHLHGHVMSVLAVDGRPIQGSPLRLDTAQVGPHQTWDVQFVADNPGIWMLHCHVLLHASMGMSMTINYAGVTTPYVMGTRTGNLAE